MKIAFIGQKGIPATQGGVEKHVQDLSNNLAEAGLDIYVYSRTHYTGNKDTKYNKINIVNIPSINTKNLDAITHTFFSTIHTLFRDYDIIHYHGVGPSLLSWIPRLLKPKAKVVVTFHCIDRFHQKWSTFARLMLGVGEWAACKFPHETIVISQILKTYCRDKFDTDCAYIPHAIKVDPQEQTSDVLDKYNLKEKEYFLSASRLVKHKGIHTLIKAYQKLNTNKKLVIAGSTSNTDDYEKYLRGLAAGNKNIIFTGRQSGIDMETLFRKAYLFVQPSVTEGLSIALLEATSYNTPVLVSDIPENLEATHGLSLHFKTGDTLDLSDKLAYAQSHPEELADRNRQMNQRLQKIHNWTNVTNQVIDLYQTTSGENTTTGEKVSKTV